MTSRERALRRELADLKLRLAEAEQTLDAIRSGEVDSLVVEGPAGLRVYALEGASHSYRVLIEAMSEGAITLGQDGVVLYCNERFARMLDRPLQRLMGTSLQELVPQRFQQGLRALLRAAEGGESRTELALLSSSGEEVPAYLSVNAIDDEGRRILCLVATDLRAQKRNEEILAAGEFARAVLQQAAEAIVVCDATGRIVRASAAAGELCGRDPLPSALEDAFPITFSDGPHAGRGASALAAAAVRGESLRGAAATLARGGASTVELLVSAAPLHGTDGTGAGCIITMFDVTAHRRAEEALREANRRKDEFLGMLSHELRNPLAPIRNSVYILQHADPTAEQAARARSIIERQTQHLTRLVDDLLDVTRIARGKIELRQARVDLREVLSRASDDFRALIDERGIAFRTALPDGRIWINADPTRITQVVGNLLHNAAKFTRRGDEVWLSLRTGGGAAEISVRDSGAGIDAALLPHVFEAFVQGDRTLARTAGGLGLGLALVKAVTELHGGSVRAESAGSGRGAEFVVRLPLAPEAAPAARQQPGLRPATSGRSVLVVDDNADAAESLADLVKMLGHTPDIAHDGPTAVEKARASPPDIILCDIGLPGMSGYEVAAALREIRANGTQLIAVSGYAQPEDVKRAVEAGFDKHLAKPPDPDEIERLLG